MGVSRREVLKLAAGACVAAAAQAGQPTSAQARSGLLGRRSGWVTGMMTGAQALAETLQAEGAECVFGIPGAQQNELWDALKSQRLGYMLVTHEFSAATMADGYARSTGRPGVLCVVPGPGLTNALGGIGEALLDSVPLVCVVGDVANGERGRPFQVHALNQTGLLQQVTKRVFVTQTAAEIPAAVRQAFQLAASGEPGPAGVVVPYNLLIETSRYQSPPLGAPALPLDEAALQRALRILQNRRTQVGIYAGLGCMDYAPTLTRVAELLQAPVATSICGKGVIDETHPLAVGWGYGPQATSTAEAVFKDVDLVLAIGVRYSEVSTGFYSQPNKPLIHVDINADNLGRVMPAQVCVHADAGVFLGMLLEQADCLRRPENARLHEAVRRHKSHEQRHQDRHHARCGVDPMAFIKALRRLTCRDALCFVDVTLSQYWAAEAFTTYQPRTVFNPTDNQAMGWSIPASLGAQRVHPGSQVVTITGDGCFLMSAMEISTAARESLPVKFFVLDDQAYQYMQALQRPAYLRTTATVLARLDYRALAHGWGVAYQEIQGAGEMEPRIRGALNYAGPVLTRVVTDYRDRPSRWIKAAKSKYIRELTPQQRTRFLARIGSRALQFHRASD